MKQPDSDSLLQKYLTESLSEREKMQFETLLTKDTAFQKEVQMYENLKSGLEGIGLDKLRTEVASWEDRYQHKQADIVSLSPPENSLTHSDERTSITSLLKSPYGVAASVSFIILFSLVYLLFLSTPESAKTPKELFAANFQPYEDLISVRGVEASPQTSRLILGMEAYNRGDYEEAVRELTAYHVDSPEDPQPNLYIAISYTILSEFTQANKYYVQAMRYPNFREQGQWYQALSFLKAGETEAAIKRLQAISLQSPFHYKKIEATQLLNDLVEYRDKNNLTDSVTPVVFYLRRIKAFSC